LYTIEQHSRNRPPSLFFPQYLPCLDPLLILFERRSILTIFFSSLFSTLFL
jgi:hypothetical protein